MHGLAFLWLLVHVCVFSPNWKHLRAVVFALRVPSYTLKKQLADVLRVVVYCGTFQIRQRGKEKRLDSHQTLQTEGRFQLVLPVSVKCFVASF